MDPCNNNFLHKTEVDRRQVRCAYLNPNTLQNLRGSGTGTNRTSAADRAVRTAYKLMHTTTAPLSDAPDTPRQRIGYSVRSTRSPLGFIPFLEPFLMQVHSKYRDDYHQHPSGSSTSVMTQGL